MGGWSGLEGGKGRGMSLAILLPPAIYIPLSPTPTQAYPHQHTPKHHQASNKKKVMEQKANATHPDLKCSFISRRSSPLLLLLLHPPNAGAPLVHLSMPLLWVRPSYVHPITHLFLSSCHPHPNTVSLPTKQAR